jgi:hypothetical protein
MAYGVTRVAQVNTLRFDQPSESIWASNKAYQDQDECTGFFIFQHFLDSVTAPSFPNSFTPSTGAGFAYNVDYDHVVNAVSGTVANAFIQTYTRPLGVVAAGSGQMIWFEAEIALSAINQSTGVFVGLANTLGLVPANTNAASGIVSAASGTKASNTIGPVANTSLIGFWSHGDAASNFDAIYLNAGTAQPPTTTTGNANGTVQTVLVNTLTAAANNPNPANLAFSPPAAPGTLVAAASSTGSVVSTATGFVKLGVLYDGQKYVYWFVNGTQVAKQAVDATFDQLSRYGGIVCLTVPSTTAVTLLIDFLRIGYKEY